MRRISSKNENNGIQTKIRIIKQKRIMKFKTYSSIKEAQKDIKFGDLIIRGDDREFRYIEIVLEFIVPENQHYYKLKTLLLSGFNQYPVHFNSMINKINTFYPYPKDYKLVKKVIYDK